MQTISDLKKSDNYIKSKKDFFSKKLELKSFFLLIKPNKKIYNNSVEKELIEIQIEKLIKKGFRNIEISWSDNENWFNYVSNIKLKFPDLNLGSASIIKNLKDLKEAIDLNCKIIKIYPVKDKNELINISQYKNIDFIAAGGLSISDLSLYKYLGYKAIVIGNKGFKNKAIDPKIYEWLKDKSN